MTAFDFGTSVSAGSADYSNSYCTDTDVQNRLTSYGLTYLVDRDTVDGYRGGTEVEYIEAAVHYADSIVDTAVAPHRISIATRVTDNDWLRDRAVDIAAYRVFSLAGRDIPEPISEAYATSMQMLERAREGDLEIPNLEYQSKVTDTGRHGPYPRAFRIR